jgi:hypothetical protein
LRRSARGACGASNPPLLRKQRLTGLFLLLRLKRPSLARRNPRLANFGDPLLSQLFFLADYACEGKDLLLRLRRQLYTALRATRRQCLEPRFFRKLFLARGLALRGIARLPALLVNRRPARGIQTFFANLLPLLFLLFLAPSVLKRAGHLQTMRLRADRVVVSSDADNA